MRIPDDGITHVCSTQKMLPFPRHYAAATPASINVEPTLVFFAYLPNFYKIIKATDDVDVNVRLVSLNKDRTHTYPITVVPAVAATKNGCSPAQMEAFICFSRSDATMHP